MSDLIVTEKSNITAIADAVRTKTGITNSMTLNDIVNGINEIEAGSVANETSIINKIIDPDNYPLDTNDNGDNIITLEVGKLSRTSGSNKDDEGGLRTPNFISVTPGQIIYPVYEELATQGTFCFLLYDSSYNFITTSWFEEYCYSYIRSGKSLTIPSDIGAAYLKAYASISDTEGTLTLKSSSSSSTTKAEFKKIYIADHGYSIYGDDIDDDTMHKLVVKADGKDDNTYNIVEIKAPTANPQEATIALMNWGNGTKQFVDFSSMTYRPDKPTVEIVCQTRGGEPLPEFSVRYNDGNGAGRVKKFAVAPNCIPVKLTSAGIEVRRNNNYNNSALTKELVTVNLVDLYDKVNIIYDALLANGTIAGPQSITPIIGNGGININTGENADSSTNHIRTANFIKCEESTTYTFTTNGLQWALLFYDENKDFLTGWNNGGSCKYLADSSYTTPAGAKYMRLFCEDSADISNILTIQNIS